MNQIFLPYIVKEQPASITKQFHKLLMEHPEQCRPQLNINQKLIDAAEYRAKHMADNNYFDHDDPFTGETTNEVVTRFGFKIHRSYPTKGNQGESIIAGNSNLLNAFNSLLDSPSHRDHLLGLENFFCQQLQLGLGFSYNDNSDYKFYYSILIYKGEND